MLFDAGTSQKRIDFKAFKEFIATKLQVARIFRQRLVQTPLKLDYPYWIEDPDFDLDRHLHHVALPKPGGWKELCELQSHVFALPLDRDCPLWEMYFIDGLDHIEDMAQDSFAVIMKIHHVAIDGVSGAQIMDGMLDTHSPY